MFSWLWIIFSLIFLILSVFHLYISRKTFPQLPRYSGIGKINGVKLGIKEFVDELNERITDMNKVNRWINIVASIGYFAAFLTSVYSYILTL
jgi:hypothetical protein